MSVISSKAPDVLSSRSAVLGPRRQLEVAIDIAAAVFVVAMMGLIIALPGHEAGPFHIMFLAVAIAYGYRMWPLIPTICATAVITLLAGWLMVAHASAGRLASPELAEIPLMPLVLLVMVWHARRRMAAVEQLKAMAGRQLDAVDREREFFRDASHAIRTPVTIARGHLELVETAVLEDEVRSDLSVAMLQLERMSALSNRLLAVARLDSGGALSKQPMDLGDLIDEMAANWSANSDRIWRVRTFPTGVIRADPEWIEMTLDALIENAVNFTPLGGVISLRCDRVGDRCIVEVGDSGPGIEPDDLPHVFDRFWHRKPPYGAMGTGLGLSMARSAATAHGGALSVRNEPPGGAVFTLELPAT
ncbi:sensor histidine kinase [Kribbella pratensis]|uniref:histidine kinase n=1 Tax=Kribbella pratensis TaxID=2512112 RepID=A0A4R8CPK0_9ACTN|nr:HAMP domain-containing sensor histidine kinase [Kribbella pratensis]TDW78064.1 signal transduction histidine kinase [Kribbella pratensis]